LKDVVAKTRYKLSQLGYTQQPQAEGRRVGKPFMAVRGAAPGAPGAVGCISQTGPTGPGPEPAGDGTFALPFDKEGPQNVCPHCGKAK
jgi:hypothetical protein